MALIDDLVAYWPCDEASGDILDAHGSNHLTDRNTVGATAGKINGCRRFVRTNSESADISDNTDLSMGDIAFNINLWVRLTTNAATMVLVSKGINVTSTTTFDYGIYFSTTSGGRFVFRVGGASNTTVTANNFGTPSIATWYMVNAYHDPVANVIGISVNNGTPNTAAFSAGVPDTTQAFYMGWDVDAARYLNGDLDEVGIWKRLHSAQDKTDLYNGGVGLAYPFSLGHPAIRRYTAAELKRFEIGREGLLVT
jgi:hypothetical protein